VKRYIVITALCIVSSLHSAENQRAAQEWDAKAYEVGSDLQTDTFLQFLKNNNIQLQNRRILDVGCGTGRLSAIYAETAQEVHAIDASKNMILFAQEKYKDTKNISFEHRFAEDVTSQKLFQLALASSTVHWFENKNQAFNKIGMCLEKGGELFCDVRTMENSKPVNLIAAGKIISQIPVLNWFISEDNIMNHVGSSYPTHRELLTMLSDANFEIITCQEQSIDYPVTKEQLRLLEWPIVTSRPLMPHVQRILSEDSIRYYFNNYVDELAKNLLITPDGKFAYPVNTTIVHARKK